MPTWKEQNLTAALLIPFFRGMYTPSLLDFPKSWSLTPAAPGNELEIVHGKEDSSSALKGKDISLPVKKDKDTHKWACFTKD